MIRAFLVKDLRLAAKAGTPLPGLGVLLVVQGAVCLAIAGWTLFFGFPPEFWGAVASFVVTVAFVLAYIGPGTQAAFATAQEAHPDLAESLATSPLGPTQFFLGKAALATVQGLAVQSALLPIWVYLVVSGVLSAADVLRFVVAMAVAVPVTAVSGSTRLGGLGSARLAMLLRAQQRRGIQSPLTQPAAQQTWVALLGMGWMVQAMRGVGAFPGMTSPTAVALVDLVRPAIPIVGMDRGGFVAVFTLPVPVILLSVLLLGSWGGMRLAAAVASSVRASPREREIAWRALVGTRAVIVLYLAGAMWTLSPAASAATAGLAALLYALVGLPQEEDRLRNAVSALVPCAAPALVSAVGAGPAGLACWAGIAAACAAGAAALPPARAGSERRQLALGAVLLAGFAAPALTLALTAPASPLRAFGSLAPVFAAWSWVSLPAAVVSLASTALGPLQPWTFLTAHSPTVAQVPPWFAAPAAFAAIAWVSLLLKPKAAAPARKDG